MFEINNRSWEKFIYEEMKKEYFQNMRLFLEKEYKEVFPPVNEVFKALDLVSYEDVKVVILGQDPYHGEGEAHGLAFSVKKGIKIPPSLRNIFKELKKEYPHFEIPKNGELYPWAKEGVLLLNTTLTVEKDKANSHNKIGWQFFTDEIIKKLNEREKPVVFILWGKFAISKKMLITNPTHLVLESPHPSPLSASRGFFGNNHFLKVNDFLKSKGIKEIDWTL